MNQKKKLAEYLADNSFIKWLKEGRPSSDKQWTKWSMDDPAAKQIIADATDVDKGLPFKKQPNLSAADTERNWESIERKMSQTRVVPLGKRSTSTRRALAGVLLLLIIGTGFWWYQTANRWIEVATAAGETQVVKLPDGSMAHLGAASTLRYNDNRSVELEGEVYFEVVQTAGKDRFVVEQQNLRIEVLGTAFNVNAHRAQPIVSLTEGRVKLTHPQTGVERRLKAGQTVQYDAATHTFELLTTPVTYWGDWRTGYWTFNEGVPMKEIIQRMEETYGWTCIIGDPSILAEQPAGRASVQTPEELLQSLSVLLDVDFKLTGEVLSIERK